MSKPLPTLSKNQPIEDSLRCIAVNPRDSLAAFGNEWAAECAGSALKLIDELRKDAERYRWLMGNIDGNAQDDIFRYLAGHVIDKSGVDELIDFRIATANSVI